MLIEDDEYYTLKATFASSNHPCLCLWRFSVQITMTVLLRLIILQLRQRFLTDARTFISLSSLLFPTTLHAFLNLHAYCLFCSRETYFKLLTLKLFLNLGKFNVFSSSNYFFSSMNHIDAIIIKFVLVK